MTLTTLRSNQKSDLAGAKAMPCADYPKGYAFQIDTKVNITRSHLVVNIINLTAVGDLTSDSEAVFSKSTSHVLI